MSEKQRKVFGAAFKAKVGLEAILKLGLPYSDRLIKIQNS